MAAAALAKRAASSIAISSECRHEGAVPGMSAWVARSGQVDENFTWPDVAIKHAGRPARRCRAHCGCPLRPADVGQHRVERADSVERKRRGIGDQFWIVERADRPFAIVGQRGSRGSTTCIRDAPTLPTSKPLAANCRTIRLPRASSPARSQWARPPKTGDRDAGARSHATPGFCASVGEDLGRRSGDCRHSLDRVMRGHAEAKDFRQVLAGSGAVKTIPFIGAPPS